MKDVTFNYDDPSAWKVKIQAEGKDAAEGWWASNAAPDMPTAAKVSC